MNRPTVQYNMLSFFKDILSDRELNCARDELIAVNHSIRHLLSMWFSVGFLNMERVTWQSPCDITEKVSSDNI